MLVDGVLLLLDEKAERTGKVAKETPPPTLRLILSRRPPRGLGRAPLGARAQAIKESDERAVNSAIRAREPTRTVESLTFKEPAFLSVTLSLTPRTGGTLLNCFLATVKCLGSQCTRAMPLYKWTGREMLIVLSTGKTIACLRGPAFVSSLLSFLVSHAHTLDRLHILSQLLTNCMSICHLLYRCGVFTGST